MRRILLTMLVLAFSISGADARRRHHGHSRTMMREEVVLRPPSVDREASRDARTRGPARAADLIPMGWQLQPPDATWKGRRYLSPDGGAWLALYESASNKEPIQKHMQTVAFVEGEEVTYLRGERNWIVVSGLKDGNIFYRKAVLACGGIVWRHIALQYPASAKSMLDPHIARASRAFDGLAEDRCGESVFSQ
jgi:hypothetical protein